MPDPAADDSIGDERAWQAVLDRDRAFDGRFVMAVTSTGIYCRPSCPARHPARGNVRFLADGPAASAAGFRPCRRCRPDDLARDDAAVLTALERIRASEGIPTLAELADAVGYSPAHFQRLFTRQTGLSPAAYARALRAGRMAEALTCEDDVTGAIYAAGFSAPSRFYEAGQERLGMTPSAWVDGGRGMSIRWAVVPTSLGSMLVAATEKGVCRLAFGEDGESLAARFPNAERIEGGEEFAALLAQVVAAVETPGRADHIPLDVRGTAFQEAVWRALRTIPPGETRTYAQIAAAVGSPGAVRAAGSANGANPVAVLVPCHRVIRTDGSLGGYAYGLAIKQALLDREQS